MNRKLYALMAIVMACFTWATAQVTVTDASINAGDNVTWTSDNEYLLDGFVYVETGATLTIEAGTVIKGANTPSNGDRTSALIIARGATIIADGTADAPIIFTAQADDPANGTDIPNPQLQRGLWGGIIILGSATIARPDGEDGVEGLPADEARARYGGDNDMDNSGILRYVSIRHGGDELAPGDEINGLTLGGVGSGTTLEHIEVFANLDDGIEFFGGTVDLKYAAVSFCGDDSYDWDFGWRGRGQFWFSLNGDDLSGRAGEHDGASPDGQDPFSNPTIFNATYIGSGISSEPGNEGNDIALLMRDRTGGSYSNSIITDFPGIALAVEDREGDEDAYNNFVNGDLRFVNNLWFGFGAGDMPTDFLTLSDDDTPLDDDKDLIATLVADGNETAMDPSLGGISRMPNAMLDPRPNSGSPAFGGDTELPEDDGFFCQVAFKGAFNNRTNWCEGWTALSVNGFFGDLAMTDQTVVVDADIESGDTLTLTSGTEWILDGFVYVEENACLIIEAGTVIKAISQPTTGDRTSALIIARGGKIIADGTADAPIIFTAQADDPFNGMDIPNPQLQRGLWGGIIVLGNATIARPDGEDGVEGLPADESRARFGGMDDMDNSGILRYVSIRHGGDELAPGDEINGLTLGGVGSGTTLEYIEVFANLDDGIEFFGGTVDLKYASVSFCGDDSYDWDFGWRGRGQFWFSLNGDDISGRAGEHDGASPDGQDPFSQPNIFNATYIGSGVASEPGNEGNDIALLMRDRTGGFYHNSIITDFPGIALAIEDREGDEDAYNNFVNGDLKFVNNLWFGFGAGDQPTDFLTLSDDDTPLDDDKTLIETIVADGNEIVDPNLGGISRLPEGLLDPRPNGDSPAFGANENVPPNDGFFTSVVYRGAFSTTDNWALAWTALDVNGFFGDLAMTAEATITDADIQSGDTLTLTANTTWTLDGFVYVEEDAVLIIEAGTVIKGKSIPTSGDRSSALIIARGGKIFAEGRADAPIIFTAEADDPADGMDVPNPQLARGLWGGVIILGNATIARPDGEDGIEGLPADESRARFGGMDDMDNSGILRYVSIRHGGDELAPGDEINGLTLGGVGSGTTLEYIEVFANLDDGIEFFGGTVDLKYASVSFCGDDSFDWDFGWRGRGQYWFSLNGDDVSGRAGEHDGASPDGQDPFSNPTVFNATYIGSGIDAMPGNEGNDIALLMRDRTGGSYNNSIITDFPGIALAIENRDGDEDAYANFLAGDLSFKNNVWFGFGAGDMPTDFLTLSDDDTPLDDDGVLIDSLVACGNVIDDPRLVSIGRTPTNELDPRPQFGPAYANGGANVPADDYFMAEGFLGAFDPDLTTLWIDAWTALSVNNFIAELTTNVETQVKEANGVVFEAPVPTPAFDLTNINFELPRTANVTMNVFDLSGRLVTNVMNNERLSAGEHTRTIDVSNMANGTYVVTMFAEGKVLTHKLMVSK